LTFDYGTHYAKKLKTETRQTAGKCQIAVVSVLCAMFLAGVMQHMARKNTTYKSMDTYLYTSFNANDNFNNETLHYVLSLL